MGLETGVTYIEDLVDTNPVGATDNVDEGDDHIRNTKTAVKGSFPNLGAAAVTLTAAEINDLPTKTGTETLTNKTLTTPILTSPEINEILDSNSNELLELTSNASAVNNVRIANAPTGSGPAIRADSDTDTDVNLNLYGKGAGYLTTNDERVHGMVILDDPELIVNGSATAGSWVTVNNATLNTATATKAILRCYITAGSTTTNHLSQTFIRKTGASATACPIGSARSTDTTNQALSVAYSGEGVVNLDASYDFDWNTTNSAGTSVTSIWLVGYYV